MRSGRAGTELFREGLRAGLAALLGVFLLVSSATALTWGEINQQIGRCVALTNEATTAVEGVNITKITDEISKKKALAKLRKAENDLGQVIEIYQTLYQADLPPAKVMPSILSAIKSSISRNLGMAKNSLKQVQSMRPVLNEVLKDRNKVLSEQRARQRGQYVSPDFSGPAGLRASAMQMDLVIAMRDLRYQTSLLQKRLQAQKLR